MEEIKLLRKIVLMVTYKLYLTCIL